MLAVVVYHAKTSLLPGGFLGVTAFLTLSGYLITSGLLRELYTTKTIDVLGFYRRRLKRLFPLMVCVVAVVALACAVRAPQLLVKMRPDAAPALLFVQNWWYIVRKQSYFEASGLPSPITHFWFLSVIVQFYLLMPLLMLLLSRVLPSHRWQRRVVGALAIGSAVLAAFLYDPAGDPSRVYYGTDTRLAEILVGAWLAFAWPPDGNTRLKQVVSERLDLVGGTALTDALGLLALVAMGALCRFLTGYSTILYRGGLFGVSVLTAIVTAAVTRKQSLLGRLLGLPPFVVLAKRSFGFYLWHYPLFLILNPATRTTELPWWGWLIEIAVLFVLVELSYRFVEQRAGALVRTAPQESSRGRHAHGAAAEKGPISPLLVALYGIPVLAATALLAIGPFWYEDGAALQMQNTNTERPAASQATEQAEPQDVQATPEVAIPAHRSPREVVEAAAMGLRERTMFREYFVDPETGTTDAPVILIGDSVPAGAVDQFYAVFPEGYIDAVVGRQLYDADDVYLEDRGYGIDKDIVVYSSGDNGVATEEDVVSLIEATGGRRTFLVTTRVPLPLQDMNNALFWDVASRYDNVEVIDWYSYSAGHDEYFWDDGTHLRPEGAEAYVAMLRDAICTYE